MIAGVRENKLVALDVLKKEKTHQWVISSDRAAGRKTSNARGNAAKSRRLSAYDDKVRQQGTRESAGSENENSPILVQDGTIEEPAEDGEEEGGLQEGFGLDSSNAFDQNGAKTVQSAINDASPAPSTTRQDFEGLDDDALVAMAAVFHAGQKVTRPNRVKKRSAGQAHGPEDSGPTTTFTAAPVPTYPERRDDSATHGIALDERQRKKQKQAPDNQLVSSGPGILPTPEQLEAWGNVFDFPGEELNFQSNGTGF